MESNNKVFEIDLSRFKAIDLSALEKEHLQDRVDTKFALHQSSLPDVLSQVEDSHRVLSVEGYSIQPYRNLYFDDAELSFYFHHHNRKGNRCKVRLREYGSSNDVFFEVKQKINKNRTVKQRLAQSVLLETLSKEAEAFLKPFVPADVGALQPTLWCDFNRITLLSPDRQERMTVDYNIQVRNSKSAKTYSGLTLIEVKHNSSKPSSFERIAKKNRIERLSISKYVMGMAHLHPQLKQNNFRMKLLAIEKILNTKEVHHGL